MNERPIEIYTDGACSGNPGPGGWGALLICGGETRELWGGEAYTTNNRMELTAVIQAIAALKRPVSARLYTDSVYVQQGIGLWIHNWKKQGWRTADRKAVKNVELWQTLDALAAPHRLEWIWVKGHAGNPGNERADQLARRGIAQQSLPAGEDAPGDPGLDSRAGNNAQG
ncbi:MAG: ribonuclease HI [Zoogloeaceae bacterium]|jgi:ribonuclease HI|nr:ribonuclease HI [Zoogloeaceae bacterium]